MSCPRGPPQPAPAPPQKETRRSWTEPESPAPVASRARIAIAIHDRALSSAPDARRCASNAALILRASKLSLSGSAMCRQDIRRPLRTALRATRIRHSQYSCTRTRRLADQRFITRELLQAAELLQQHRHQWIEKEDPAYELQLRRRCAYRPDDDAGLHAEARCANPCGRRISEEGTTM